MSAYEFTVKDINGSETKLSEYQGKVALIVNTASKCGYTKQYAGLQSLYDRYKEKGFVVLGFPSNDFGGQEPGSEKEIVEFCDLKFKVKFPMFSKITVKGSDKAPIYDALINSSIGKGAEVAWNFEKFLVNQKGEVLARYKSGVEPSAPEISSVIEKTLHLNK